MKKFNIIFFVAIMAMSCHTNQKTDENKTESLAQKEDKRYDLALRDKLGIFDGLTSPLENVNNPVTEDKVKLGKLLYFDKRLSTKENVSCNSCHNLKTFGVDNLPFSPGDDGKLGGRNSPTVLNAVLHKFQFWDGRAKDLEEQAGMPIMNPVEMAIPNEKYLVERLSKIPKYKELFSKAFPNSDEPLSFKNIANAIAAFERKLITKSRFDHYLAGKHDALSLEEKKGLSTFINTGCTDCHNGAALGGNALKKFGEKHDYWEYTKSTKIDNGLTEVTKDEAHLYMFKVPSLINVEKTFPYFHDGSVKKMDEAVKIMAKTQLDIDLSESETKNISAFLKSLTANIPKEYQELTESLP